ncbi:MAG TPA: coproporphyrinogen III oxidase family protein, partial [Thermodesulfobacteriota bacterium]|nr:coproporphyrinogen III oxidase family protein [Thermodesulfobacteriota bacterium]
MRIEDFITRIARKQNARYLRFSPEASLVLPPPTQGVPLLLYLHVPFCQELCPYCSFNRIVFQEPLARAYFAALRSEISLYRDRGYRFSSLYVGGGTPTILMDELAATLEHAAASFSLTEISVETNPNHLTEGNLSILKDLGVNRLSVGVQSFDDDLLRAMERYHKYGSGSEIVQRLAASLGRFDTLNVDMIFNFPLQTQASLERDLGILTDLQVDQLTYYPLMSAVSTREKIKTKLGGTVDYHREKQFYQTIIRHLAADYQPSTAWCFSRNASMIDEYVVNFDEYAGLGSGSLGYLGGSAYANTFGIQDYIDQVKSGRLPLAAKRDFSLRDRMRYDFLMKLFGLRLDLADLEKKWRVPAHLGLLPELLFFFAIGGLRKEGKVLSLTPRGQYYWVI